MGGRGREGGKEGGRQYRQGPKFALKSSWLPEALGWMSEAFLPFPPSLSASLPPYP